VAVQALQTSVKVHPGQLVQVMYEVHNRSDQAVAARRSRVNGPQVAGQYFRKLDCFCFSTQTFAAGEVRQMPVVFVIERGLPRDVNTVTLSYTFFKWKVRHRAQRGRAVTDQRPAKRRKRHRRCGCSGPCSGLFLACAGGRTTKRDLANITPVQVIIAGIIGAAIFVTTLILLVRFIVG